VNLSADNPGQDGNISDGVLVAGNVGIGGQLLVEHTGDSASFGGVSINGIRNLLLGVLHDALS